MTRETTFKDLPEYILFWKASDGKVNGKPVYAPRRMYYKGEAGRIWDYAEFGRAWSPSDCGLTPDSPVATLDQPIR